MDELCMLRSLSAHLGKELRQSSVDSLHSLLQMLQSGEDDGDSSARGTGRRIAEHQPQLAAGVPPAVLRPALVSPFAAIRSLPGTPLGGSHAAGAPGDEPAAILLRQQLIMQAAQANLLGSQPPVRHEPQALAAQQQLAAAVPHSRNPLAAASSPQPGPQPSSQAGQAGQAGQPGQQQPKRRGRPPKADGQYSKAYLALKQYRARKKSELDEMEATLAAKLAQLSALQAENAALRSRQGALEMSIAIQDKMVAQLAALQVSQPPGGEADDGAGGGAQAAQPQTASALVAAVTGEPDDGAAGGAAAAAVEPNNWNASNAAAAAAAAAQAHGPDWAGVAAPGQLGEHPGELLQAGEVPPVPELLERYAGYVHTAAAQLGTLAGLLQARCPQQFPPDQPVPPSAVGALDPTSAAALGVPLPPWPFHFAEFLALGNAERIPPALPAINLLSGEHESIEPEIWKTVASQLTLRPWQVERMSAAWQLFNTSLSQVNAERAQLMGRLQDALQQQQSAAGQGASSSGGGGALSDMQLLDSLLHQAEYHDLAGAIDDNLAREDGIMILMDCALGHMLDDLQRCQVSVCSWPFMPLMGSICAWLVGDSCEPGTGGGRAAQAPA